MLVRVSFSNIINDQVCFTNATDTIFSDTLTEELTIGYPYGLCFEYNDTTQTIDSC